MSDGKHARPDTIARTNLYLFDLFFKMFFGCKTKILLPGIKHFTAQLSNKISIKTTLWLVKFLFRFSFLSTKFEVTAVVNERVGIDSKIQDFNKLFILSSGLLRYFTVKCLGSLGKRLNIGRYSLCQKFSQKLNAQYFTKRCKAKLMM